MKITGAVGVDAATTRTGAAVAVRVKECPAGLVSCLFMTESFLHRLCAHFEGAGFVNGEMVIQCTLGEDQPRVNKRRPYGRVGYSGRELEGYVESDRDYVLNNLAICVAFLEDLEERGLINEEGE